MRRASVRRDSLICVFVLALTTASLHAQDSLPFQVAYDTWRKVAATLNEQGSLGVTDPSWNGIWIRFATRVEPSGDNLPARLAGAVLTEPGKPHHIINDPVIGGLSVTISDSNLPRTGSRASFISNPCTRPNSLCRRAGR